MEKEHGHMTERMLNLTLEIIYLLTGENYIAFKLSDGFVPSNMMKIQRPAIEPPSHPLRKNKKVKEVTSEIIELLTGENVTFSFCTSDVMVEKRPPLTSPDGSRSRKTSKRRPSPQYSGDSAEKHQEIPHRYQDMLNINQKEVTEEEKETSMMGDEPCKEEEGSPETSSDSGDPQENLKAEEHVHVIIKEEEIVPEIGLDGQHNGNYLEKSSFMSTEPENEVREDSAEENPIPLNLHLALPSADLSFNSSTHGARFKNVCPPAPRLTDNRGGERFPCTVCGRVFAQKSILISHQRNHTVEEPYTCPICNKCFSRKSTFIEHERTHTGEKPYSCSECGKRFTQIGHLIVHQRIHTAEKPYPCSECGKCFTQIGHLIVHQRTHTGEKPYSCSECGKRFPISSALTRHKRIHTGEKPYVCSECGKSFTRRSYLFVHQKTHSADKP